MKVCPICGASLIATVHVGMQQDWEGNWKICGADSQDDINDMAENPLNEARCPNVQCGNAYIYSDPSRLIQRAVIAPDPSIRMVSDAQLKEYYYSVVDPRYPECIPQQDGAYEHWKESCVAFIPWSGIIGEALDV